MMVHKALSDKIDEYKKFDIVKRNQVKRKMTSCFKFQSRCYEFLKYNRI